MIIFYTSQFFWHSLILYLTAACGLAAALLHLLLVTGTATRNMEQALIKTWNATPDPKLVVAAAPVPAVAAFSGIPTPPGTVSTLSCRWMHIFPAARRVRRRFCMACSKSWIG